MSRENERERGRVEDDGWCMWISQKSFLVCCARRLLLLRMTSCEFISHRAMVFGVVFFIHEAIRFTRSCRIYCQLYDLEQDKPISLLLKPFSSNKPLFHSEFHFEFSTLQTSREPDFRLTRFPDILKWLNWSWNWHIPRATLEDSLSVFWILSRTLRSWV